MSRGGRPGIDPRRAALVACLAGVVAGCDREAIVYRDDGPPLEGEVVDGDARRIVLRADGQTHVVERRRVVDVDHPGNVLFVTGGALLAVSAMFFLRWPRSRPAVRASSRRSPTRS